MSYQMFSTTIGEVLPKDKEDIVLAMNKAYLKAADQFEISADALAAGIADMQERLDTCYGVFCLTDKLTKRVIETYPKTSKEKFVDKLASELPEAKALSLKMGAMLIDSEASDETCMEAIAELAIAYKSMTVVNKIESYIESLKEESYEDEEEEE